MIKKIQQTLQNQRISNQDKFGHDEIVKRIQSTTDE